MNKYQHYIDVRGEVLPTPRGTTTAVATYEWIKFLQSLFPLGFNDYIYHESNIFKMPDFDVFSLLECTIRKVRPRGRRKKTATLSTRFVQKNA